MHIKLYKNKCIISTHEKDTYNYEEIIFEKDYNKISIKSTYDGTCGVNNYILNKQQLTNFIEFLTKLNDNLI